HRLLTSTLYTPSFTELSPLREVENEAVERNMRLRRSSRTASVQGTTIAILSDPVCVEITPIIHGKSAAPRPETARMNPAVLAGGRWRIRSANVAGKNGATPSPSRMQQEDSVQPR